MHLSLHVASLKALCAACRQITFDTLFSSVYDSFCAPVIYTAGRYVGQYCVSPAGSCAVHVGRSATVCEIHPATTTTTTTTTSIHSIIIIGSSSSSSRQRCWMTMRSCQLIRAGRAIVGVTRRLGDRDSLPLSIETHHRCSDGVPKTDDANASETISQSILI